MPFQRNHSFLSFGASGMGGYNNNDNDNNDVKNNNKSKSNNYSSSSGKDRKGSLLKLSSSFHPNKKLMPGFFLLRRNRSDTDLEAGGKGCFMEEKEDKMNIHMNMNMNDLPPLKPLRSCLSSGNLQQQQQQQTAANNDTTNKPLKRSVSFGDLIIREHPRTLCGMSSSGCPLLMLDWYKESSDNDNTDNGNDVMTTIPCKTIQVSLDDYENTREPRRPRPPLISKAKRERLLKKFGITDQDLIHAAEKERAETAAAAAADSSSSSANILLDVMSKAVRKTLMNIKSDDVVQNELDRLMKQSAEAQHIQKLQLEKYLAEQRKQLIQAQMVILQQQQQQPKPKLSVEEASSSTMKDASSLLLSENETDDSTTKSDSTTTTTTSSSSSSNNCHSRLFQDDDDYDDDNDSTWIIPSPSMDVVVRYRI